jgi:hypothetical protein
VAVIAMSALFKLLPYGGLYPVRFAPMLLLIVAPLWARAAMARFQLFAPLALIVALPFHFRWYDAAVPMATFEDLKAIACVAQSTPKNAVIDGAYGDATQWIPALADRAITRPHLHVSLFDELPQPETASFRFVGDRLRYPPAIGPPPRTTPLCGGKLYPLR